MIKGKVKKVSDLLNNSKWLFIFEDNNGIEYFVMTESFYKKNNFKTPVTKRELDSLDEEMKIDFDFKVIDGKNIVTGLSW